MFKVALRMAWSDIKAYFQGWVMWVILALMAFLVGVLPLLEEPGGSVWTGCMYGLCASFLLFSPRFTRSFHVVPFTIEQIKKLAVYRCIIFLGVVMLIGGIYLALAVVFSWDWYREWGDAFGSPRPLLFDQLFPDLEYEMISCDLDDACSFASFHIPRGYWYCISSDREAKLAETDLNVYQLGGYVKMVDLSKDPPDAVMYDWISSESC